MQAPRSLVLFVAAALGVRAAPEAREPAAGYLFAHMTATDYGRLYYAVSTDGLHWRVLNEGRRILDAYRGHPDICRGHDGRYYLIGNRSDAPAIDLWVSENLVAWAAFGRFAPDLGAVPDFTAAHPHKGAPKIFFDAATAQYLITWHSTTLAPVAEEPERFWSGMRTLYVTSKDLRIFSTPRRLFPFDLATIDVIVRREGDRYFAVVKDERWPSFEWPTGKSIRVCAAPALLGPWSEPSARLTPNFREAPAAIPRPDGRGWYLYYEQYPGVSYGLSTAPSLGGPWHDLYCKDYSVPASARHGCMVPIGRSELDAIVAAYGKEADRR
jgi:hypothetical protein